MGEFFHQLTFTLFAFITVASALGVLFFNNLLHAAVSLFFSLAGVAALYMTMGADFLGVAQLLVYAGGILVLLIFGIFLTSRMNQAPVELRDRKSYWLAGAFVAVGTLMSLSGVIASKAWVQKDLTYEPTAAGLGDLFLSKYLLPFELISLLLLFAMVGAVMLVKKEVED